MKQITKEQFYASVGAFNVHPYITSNTYPYTTEWRNPAGKVYGRVIPKIDKKYSHLYEDEYFLSEDVEVRLPRESVRFTCELEPFCGSWIIVSRATGKPVLETFERSTAEAVNQNAYEVLTAYQWLVRFNAETKSAKQTKSSSTLDMNDI